MERARLWLIGLVAGVCTLGLGACDSTMQAPPEPPPMESAPPNEPAEPPPPRATAPDAPPASPPREVIVEPQPTPREPLEFPISEAPEVFDPTQAGVCEELEANPPPGVAPDAWITCVPILYATNREPGQIVESRLGAVADAGEIFTARPDPACEPDPERFAGNLAGPLACHLGQITVSVPASRRQVVREGGGAITVGQAGRDFDLERRRDVQALSDTFVLHDPVALTGEEFYDVVGARLAAASSDDAFVFIHGFNVTFRDAAARTAQLAYDMEFDGPAFFFSWPANGGEVLDYVNDQQDADLSVDALARFLNGVRNIVEANTQGRGRVHIIAHSMGTRVAAQAVARLEPPLRALNRPAFGELIFAAGDLDTNLFRQWVGAAAPSVERITLYASSQDRALMSSDMLANLSRLSFWGSPSDPKQRIGLFQPGGEVPLLSLVSARHQTPVHTIDISEAEKGLFAFIRHASYANSAAVTNDIRCLIAGVDGEPGARAEHFRTISRGGYAPDYWRFAPASSTGGRAPGLCADTIPALAP